MLVFAGMIALLAIPTNVIVGILLLSVAYTTLTLKAQRKFGNQRRLKELQLKMKEITKELNAMAKRGEDIKAKQAEMMPHFNEQTKLMLKSMVVVLPMAWAMFYLILPTMMGGWAAQTMTFLITLPVTTWIFIGGATAFGFAVSTIVNRMDKKTALREKATAPLIQQEPEGVRE